MLNPFTDHIVGLSVCNGKEALYVPINHINLTTGTLLKSQIPEDQIRELFKDLVKDPKYKWIYHNSKFDLQVFRTFLGFNMADPYWDTLICGFLLNQDEEHSLKALYNKYVAEEDEGINKFDTLFKGITFDYIPLDVSTIYAAKDALMTYELYQYQKKKLDEPDLKGIKSVLFDIEIPLIPILADMNRQGLNINMNMLNHLYEKYNTQLEKAKKEVYKEIEPYTQAIEEYRITHLTKKLDSPISISSPAQLSILFYDIIKYNTKSGKGTGEEELQEINSPLTKALLEYRKLSKLIDAFLVAIPKQIEESDGKIHTQLNQIGAATGRFASSNPNLQQIPSHGDGKELRRLFGAEKGYIMLSSDFSQFIYGHYISNNI